MTTGKQHFLGNYKAIDPTKTAAIVDATGPTALTNAAQTGQFGALARNSIFPAIMLAGYLGLIAFFRSCGGYKPVSLTTAH